MYTDVGRYSKLVSKVTTPTHPTIHHHREHVLLKFTVFSFQDTMGEDKEIAQTLLRAVEPVACFSVQYPAYVLVSKAGSKTCLASFLTRGLRDAVAKPLATQIQKAVDEEADSNSVILAHGIGYHKLESMISSVFQRLRRG